MRLRVKNFNAMGGSQKNPIFRGSNEKPIHMWEFPKKGASTVCRFKRGLGKKEKCGVFEGWLVPQCTLLENVS